MLLAAAGLIYVLLKLRNHSLAVQQRRTAEQLLQSAAQAKTGRAVVGRNGSDAFTFTEGTEMFSATVGRAQGWSWRHFQNIRAAVPGHDGLQHTTDSQVQRKAAVVASTRRAVIR